MNRRDDFSGMMKSTLYRFYRNKKVLVPGGAGFIGSNLARRLTEYGAKVTVVDSFSKFCGANLFNLERIKNKIILVKEKIEGFVLKRGLKDYEVIFNCIGLTNHHIGFEKINVDYAINCYSGLVLLESLKEGQKKNCKMISIGSRGQYGRCYSKSVKESHPLNPLDIQAIHKTLFEYYHKIFASNYGLNLIFLRLTNVYGPGQRLKGEGIGMIGEMIKNSLSGEDIVIYGSLERVKDILFIDDVVEAILLSGLMEREDSFIYNLGGGFCRLSDLIEAVKKKIKTVKVKIQPFPDKIKKIDTGDIILDTKRMRKKTGWIPKVTLEEGIEKTLDYYKKFKKFYL